MGTYNRYAKFDRKIPNRLGKMAENLGVGVWLSLYVVMVIADVCVSQTQHSDNAALLPKCLMLYGDWLAETRSQSPNIILDKYLSKVIT